VNKTRGNMLHVSGAVGRAGRRGRAFLMLVMSLLLMLAAVPVGAAQDGPTIRIGSKDFTEQVILGELMALLLEDAGYEVERNLNLGGTDIVHQALINGELDTYVEYTGTGLLAILNMQLPATPVAGATPSAATPDAATPAASAGVDAVYEIVSREYQSQFSLQWLDPLGFNNTYTLAMRQEQAQELGITKISDLQGVAGDLRFGATQEFLVRPDGLPGLTQAYGLDFAEEQGMDPGITYQALDSEQVDVISAFATDGRIPALGLVTLEDDLGFFPPYFAAPVVSQELLDQDPQVGEVLNQLAGMIDDQAMADLNAQVDSEGEEAEDVARGFLEEQGLL
jgi:glycine betaine/choline ABC-type transport system substrate-binding protein